MRSSFLLYVYFRVSAHAAMCDDKRRESEVAFVVDESKEGVIRDARESENTFRVGDTLRSIVAAEILTAQLIRWTDSR